MKVKDQFAPSPAQSPVIDGIWSSHTRWLTIGLVLTVLGAAFEALSVATTLPATIRDLGGLELYGWAFSAFMLTNLIGVTVAGAEADRRGAALPYAVGVGLFVTGLLIAGLAPSMPVVIFGRAVQGLGAGTIASLAYVAIGRGYNETQKPRMLAITSSAWVIPGLAGPALAGLISDAVGWRWVFLGLAPLMLLAAALTIPALRRLPALPAAEAGAAHHWRVYLSAIQLAVGASIALAGLSIAGGENGVRTLISYAFATALIVGGIVLGLPALRRLLPAGTLRATPGLPATIAASGLLNLAFFGTDAFVPLALTKLRGQTATVAGITLTAATIAWSTSAWVQSHLAGRGFRRGLVLAGLGLIAIGIAAISGVVLTSAPLFFAPIGWAFAGWGMGFAFSTIALLVLESATPGQEGTASAAMQLSNGLSTAIGTGIGGALIAATSVDGTVSPTGLAIQNSVMLAVVVLAVWAALRMTRNQS